MNKILTERKKRQFSLIPFLVFAVCLLSGKLLFSVKKPLFIAGYSSFIVSSASMEPEYRVRTLVVIKNESFGSLSVGDVVVYKSDALSGGLAFHRITRITEEGFYTKGDNNEYEDNQLITEKTYVGKGVAQTYHLGFYVSAIQNPVNFIVLFVLPVLAVFLINDLLKELRRSRRESL